MKKMFAAAVLLVSSFYTTVQAGTGDKPGKAAKSENVGRHVKESFNKQFPQAQYQVWQAMNQHDLYLVRFVNKDEGVVAYLDQEGALIATARTTQLDKLPSTVKRVLDSKYGNAEVIEVLELVLEGELNYVIKLENNKARFTIKVTGNGDSREIKKEKIAKKGF
jgi:hypothetical protein